MRRRPGLAVLQRGVEIDATRVMGKIG